MNHPGASDGGFIAEKIWMWGTRSHQPGGDADCRSLELTVLGHSGQCVLPVSPQYGQGGKVGRVAWPKGQRKTESQGPFHGRILRGREVRH